MFKKFSYILFKRIVLFVLLIFSVLLIAINTSLNSFKTDKPSFFNIKQKSLHAEPTDSEKEAAWTFLTTSNRLQDIFQFKIPQIAGVDVTPLFVYQINSLILITYENLDTVVKTKLRSLAQVSDYQTSINRDIANNKAGALVWNFLKTSNSVANLKKYQIQKIDMFQLLSSLSNFPMNALYSDLTLNQRNFLISLSAIPEYNLKINNKIQTAQNAAINAWTFLKTNKRLANLKKYKINTIDGITLLPVLESAKTSTPYAELSSAQQIALYTLSQRENYQTKVTDAITAAQTAASNAWTFLKTNDRLAHLKQYQIKIINTIKILPALKDAETATEYTVLTSPEQIALYLLSQTTDYQDKVNAAIQKAENADSAWTFLTTGNRLANLKQYQIKIIDGIALLPAFTYTETSVIYKDLSPFLKNLLYNLSQLAGYQQKITNAIALAQHASEAWTFLKNSNRLANLKKYDIKIIDTIILLPNFTNIGTSTLYTSLTSAQKTTLYDLSQRTNYQDEVDDAINIAQVADSVWTFLRNNNNLANLKQYQIKIIDGITLLPNLVNIEISTIYADLSSSDKALLYTLGQKADYQQKVTDAINIAQVADSVWTFLRNNNNLANLKKYQIKIIDDITLLPNLVNIEISTIYADLSSEIQTLLYDLSQTAEYQQKIINAIQKAQITSATWTFLKTNNRLVNLKKYQIKIIDTVELLPVLTDAETSALYTDLTFAQKTSLYALSQKADYQQKVTNVIQNAETVSFEVWIFLRESDRLKNLKKYNINKIETVTLLPLWQIDPLSMNYTNFLKSNQKATLDSLSKIIKYEAKIDTAIAHAKKETLILWNYLITTNALKKIQKYEIKNIAEVDISSLKIANVKKTFDQQDDVVQEKIIELKELSDYKLKIQKEIQKTKAIVVWDYLKKSKRLQNIKKYQITMINGMEVAHLKIANMDQDYTEQNEDVKKDLIVLSKISSFENQIDQRIEDHNTIEDNNDRTLLTMIILLSLFGFLFLTTGAGFYIYKKFWISKTKK